MIFMDCSMVYSKPFFFFFKAESYTVNRRISGEEWKVWVHIKVRDTAEGLITRSPEA